MLIDAPVSGQTRCSGLHDVPHRDSPVCERRAQITLSGKAQKSHYETNNLHNSMEFPIITKDKMFATQSRRIHRNAALPVSFDMCFECSSSAPRTAQRPRFYKR
jgi:hypothetical protein